MQYLCNKHCLDRFYSTDPGERAMVDSAMFYLIGTFYPLLARATYPALRFGQYAGEVATAEVSGELKEQARKDAEPALAGPLETFNTFFLAGESFVRRRQAFDRGHSLGGNARVPARDRLRLPGLGRRVPPADGGGIRRRVLGARGRCPRLHRVREVGGGRDLATQGGAADGRAFPKRSSILRPTRRGRLPVQPFQHSLHEHRHHCVADETWRPPPGPTLRPWRQRADRLRARRLGYTAVDPVSAMSFTSA